MRFTPLPTSIPGPTAASSLLLIAALAVSPQAHAQEAWVGCWELGHVEDWAPNVDREGFPSGSAAPAPRLVLLDRLPGLRSQLTSTPGVATYRAEWIGSELRGTEVWGIRADGHAIVENTPGVREISLVMESPPTERVVPAMWFFRRTDSPIPELRANVVAREVSCPEGKEPHTQVERSELEERFGAEGVVGSFVHYDSGARRITRVNPEADRGLALGSGSGRTAAWPQVRRLVDEGRRAGEEEPLLEWDRDPEAGTAWIAGRRVGADGALSAFALHLYEASPEWLDEEGALERLLEALLETLDG